MAADGAAVYPFPGVIPAKAGIHLALIRPKANGFPLKRE
jgi:hypothetical protein